MNLQSPDEIRVRHMLEASEKVMKFAYGKLRPDLDIDEELSLALARLVEIIGEAASKVSDEVQTGHTGIPWSDIVGTRNRLIHGYEAVNLDILWQIVSRDIPSLIPKLQELLEK